MMALSGRWLIWVAAMYGSLALISSFGVADECPSGKVCIDGVEYPDIGELVVPDQPRDDQHKAKIRLAMQLFQDGRISKDGATSCRYCHDPQFGWTNAKPWTVGVSNTPVYRQVPTLYNVYLYSRLFWDGREDKLDKQAWAPITDPYEMGETVPGVLAKIKAMGPYREQFESIYGASVMQGEEPFKKALGDALATFDRTIVSANSPFDKYVSGRDRSLMSSPAIKGMSLFRGKARCIVCHNGQNFSDNDFHKIGVPWQTHETEKQRLGWAIHTGKDADKGKFRTPTLRSVAVTGPYYMHNGYFESLREVIDFFDAGGGGGPSKSPLLRQLHLTDEEKSNLEAFLTALTGEELKYKWPPLPCIPTC